MKVLIFISAFLSASNAIDYYYVDNFLTVPNTSFNTVVQTIINVYQGNYMCNTNCPLTIDVSSLTYTLYRNIDPNNGININSINACNYLQPNENIAVIVPGWMQAPSVQWIMEMKNNYTTYVNKSVLVVNWTLCSVNLDYFQAQACVEPVGIAVGEFLFSLNNCGVAPKNLHGLGTSLGAHILSNAGKKIINFGDLIDRITGLDAAGPCFEFPYRGLYSTDARNVDVTHSNRGVLGTSLQRGTIDFDANGGTSIQPECASIDIGYFSSLISTIDIMNYIPRLFCDHMQATRDFLRSINPVSLYQSWTDSYSPLSAKTIKYGEYYDRTNTGQWRFYTSAIPGR